MWNQKDDVFMMMILRQSQPMEKIIQKGLRYRMDLAQNLSSVKIWPPQKKKSAYESVFIPIGMYYFKGSKFQWYSTDISELMRGNLNEKYNLRELFGSTTTINKLFRPEYRIPEEYKDVPAYFLGMMNPGMRLVRFESPDHSFLLYGLAVIDTIPYQFNFDRFIDNMVVYRDYSHEFKKKRK